MPQGENDDETFLFCSSFDQLSLSGRYWPVLEGEPRAVVLIVHGSGEHCLRYKHVARFLSENGIACVSFDLRGHGLSGGERGFVPHIDALLDDLDCAIKHIRNHIHRERPVVIYAHGTGCVIVIAHILRRSNRALDCQAMIASTPSIWLKKRPPLLAFFVARAFANLSPHFRMSVEGNYSNIYTNDPAVVDAYRKDPLVHDRWAATTVSMFF